MYIPFKTAFSARDFNTTQPLFLEVDKRNHTIVDDYVSETDDLLCYNTNVFRNDYEKLIKSKHPEKKTNIFILLLSRTRVVMVDY